MLIWPPWPSADAKRKATEDPASPAATKRVKLNESPEAEKKPVMKPIPFPEKVS